MRKRCITCGKVRSISQFYYRKSRGKFEATCTPCNDLRRRRKARSRLYGLKPGDFTQMLEDQDHMCAICFTPISHGASLDHDHKTGEVRGILCHNCNVGLGQFEDNPDLIHQAYMYLCTT